VAKLVASLGWLPELRCARLAGVPRSTLRSWIKDGLLFAPDNGAYRASHLVEAILVGAIRAHLSAPVTRNVLRALRTSGTLVTLTEKGQRAKGLQRYDLVIDLDISGVTFCLTNAALLKAVSDVAETRNVVVVPLAHTLQRAMAGFDNELRTDPEPAVPQRGRPSAGASITLLRGEG
jgi:hypothetical protein